MTHPEPPFDPHNFWSAWNVEPSIMIPLVLTTLIYLWGIRNLWQHAGLGHGIHKRHVSSFLGAMLALFIAFVSPLDALSEVLFSAHMVQHMILILLAAPLLVMSNFPLIFLWTLSRGSAQRLGFYWNQSTTISRFRQACKSPLVAWGLFTIALWGWHTPSLYEAALENETLHTLEHLGFLITAMLFWWMLLKPTSQKHINYGIAVPYLFLTVLQSGILGALMTFTTEPWYSYYTKLVSAWGLTPLQDQQVAGLIMWIPGGFVFTLLTIGYFAAWLQALERRGEGRSREILRTIQEQKEVDAS